MSLLNKLTNRLKCMWHVALGHPVAYRMHFTVSGDLILGDAPHQYYAESVFNSVPSKPHIVMKKPNTNLSKAAVMKKTVPVAKKTVMRNAGRKK